MTKSAPEQPGDARGMALLVVHEVLEQGAYANISLDRHLQHSRLSSEDRHLATELANGTIRMLKHLDWVLELFLTRPLSDLNPWLRNILRISAYQLLFMERIPHYAAVNSAVGMARQRVGLRLSRVANGVLRNLTRNIDDLPLPEPTNSCKYLAVYYSQPEWLVKLWLEEFDQETVRSMLDYLNRRPGLTLRNNVLRGSRAELQHCLDDEGVISYPSPRTPWGLVVTGTKTSLRSLNAFRQGRFYVQNEGSMLAVAILDPLPGERIIDMGSGVGGKATFMAELMSDQGWVDALELYPHKLALLGDNCRRLGIKTVIGHEQDILQLIPGQYCGDGVLLDAPCSGLGVLNRRADLRWRRTLQQMEALPGLQTELLQRAAATVAAGGRLVYTTCTINRRENHEVVAHFLQRNQDFHLDDFSSQIGFFPLDEGDSNQVRAGMLTLLPGKYQTDGMFYARLRRV